MRTTILFVAVMLTATGVVRAQTAPRRADLVATLHRMQQNVATISEPSERERWDANLALWQVKIGGTGAASAGANASLDAMTLNVARITEPAEKQRWQANCELWALVLGQGLHPRRADLDAMRAPLERMKENVSRIQQPAELERWRANADLWESFAREQPTSR